MELIYIYIFIFIAKCCEVTLSTVRTIVVIKGKKMLAFCIGFIEILIYLFAMSAVLSDITDPIKVISYALGFSTGNVFGIVVEKKLAIGVITAQIFTEEDAEELIQYLRDNGFGATAIKGIGKNGAKSIIQVVLDRKKLNKLKHCINKHDSDSFIIISEISKVQGGYFFKK